MECTLPKDWFLNAKLCPHGYSEERTKNPNPSCCEGCEYFIKTLLEIKTDLDDRVAGVGERITVKIAKGNTNKVILDHYPEITIILSEKTYQHLCQDYIDRMLKSK